MPSKPFSPKPLETTIEIIKATFFKALPFQSSTLLPDQLVFIQPGFKAVVHSFSIERDHVKVALLNKTFNGKNTWFLYLGHVAITKPNGEVISWVTPLSTRLKVPYLSQLDNKNDPHGTCNVTSVAMCLKYHGYKYTPDQLYLMAQSYGLSIYSPTDLQKLIRRCGATDQFFISGKIDQIKLAINDKKPCIIHGWFTQAGHIVVVTGYDETGLFINDPYGQWYESGYDNSDKGVDIHHSYNLIKRLCMPDGDLWLHIVGK